MKISLLQLNPLENVKENLRQFYNLLNVALKDNPQVVALPEMFAIRGDVARTNYACKLGEGFFLELQGIARAEGIYLSCGSHVEKVDGYEKPFNTTVTFDPHGNLIFHYQKLHLFRFLDINGKPIYEESNYISMGKPPESTYCIQIGNQSWNALTLICYDLRFPEISSPFHSDIIFYPSAFAYETGKDHWEVLLRARAIENSCYVIAPNQTGFFDNGRKHNYGHSVAIDPFGNVVGCLGEEVGVLTVDLNYSLLNAAKKTIHSL